MAFNNVGDEFECPQEFLCPMSGGLLFDPVVASDGFSYEKRDLAYWIKRQKRLKEPDRTSYEFPSPVTNVWIPVHVYENRALRDFIAIWSFREKAHQERAAKLKDFENRSVSVEDVYERVCAMFREKTPEIDCYIGRLTDIEASIDADIGRGNLTPENLRQYFLAVFTIVEDAAVASSDMDLDFCDMLRQLTESGTISNDMAMALDEARMISKSFEHSSYYRPECSLEMTRRLLEQAFQFVSSLMIAPKAEATKEAAPPMQEQSLLGSPPFVSATNTGSVAAAAMPVDTAIDNAPVLSASIAAAVAPDTAVAPRRTLTLRDATDEDAPSSTCDTAGKRLVFQRWCALLCDHIRQFETRGGAPLPCEEEGTMEFLCISPQLLNDSAIIFTTYQYTAAPAYIVDYIQRQRVPPIGPGDNGRIPLFRLMGFVSATDVVHHRTFHQLFGRVGIHVDVPNLRFETRSATDAATVVTFTCEIKRHQSYYSVAASATTVVPPAAPTKGTWRDETLQRNAALQIVAEVKEQLRQLLRYDPTLTTLGGLHGTGIGASTGAPAGETVDTIAPWVRLLGDRDVTVRQKAATAVWNIALQAENRLLLAHAGAIAPLIRLLGDGNVTIRWKAAGTLANMALHAENKVLIAEAGAIPPLVQLLGDGDVTVRKMTACALMHIAANEKNKVLLAEAGAIAPLVRLLGDSNVKVRTWAAGALWSIADIAENQILVAEAGAIPLLVRLLGDGVVEVRQKAAGALSNIAHTAENHVAVAEAGAIAPLVRLLGDGDMLVRRKAAVTLMRFAVTSENKVLVVEAGALPPLVRLLGDNDVDVRMMAAGALANIAHLADNKVLLAEAGAISPLVRLLGDDDSTVRRKAAGALMHIAVNVENQVLVANAGAVPPLVRLLGDGDVDVRRAATGALSNIANHAENQVLVAEAGAIAPLVRLLSDSDVKVRRMAAGALMHIAVNETNQVLVAAAGAIAPLAQLLGDGDVKARQKAAGALVNIAGNAENQVLVAEVGAIAPLVQLLQVEEDAETRRFAQALLDVIAVCSEGIYFRKVGHTSI